MTTPTPFQNPDQNAITDLLRRVRTVAVLGISPKVHRDSYRIAAYMQDYGWRIVPIRPGLSEVLGEKAYASLSEVPAELRAEIDVVDVFRAPEHLPEIVEECLALKLPALWLQLGVTHEAAASKARDGGMSVVMDRCIYVDYRNWVAG